MLILKFNEMSLEEKGNIYDGTGKGQGKSICHGKCGNI